MDAVSYATMCGLLAACVAAASLIPMRRASQSDPLQALRQE